MCQELVLPLNSWCLCHNQKLSYDCYCLNILVLSVIQLNSLSGTKTHSGTCEFVYTDLHDVSGTCEVVHVNSYLSYKLLHVSPYSFCWHDSLFLGAITSLCLQSREGGKNTIALIQAMVMSVVIVLGVQTLAFWALRLACNHVVQHDGFHSFCCLSKSKNEIKSTKEIKIDPFSGQAAGARQRGLVVVHGLVTLFLGIIALAVILLVVGLAVPRVLVITPTTMMVLIVSMMIIRSAIIAVASVALMMVAVVATAIMVVARFIATWGRKMSRFLFLCLLCIVGDLIKNTSHLVGCLTLLKEGNHSERVGRYRLVQVGKLVLLRLRLRKEDLFTLLLHHGYVHHLREVVTLKVAEKLHSMPHELVHWHESRLLGHAKPANQLVANVGEPGNGLEVVPDALVEVGLCPICIVWASLCDNAGPLCQAYILKALTQATKPHPRVESKSLT
jgi:hypothetical protein